MLEKLKRKFTLQSRAEILQIWNSGNEWDNLETKAKYYLSNVDNVVGVEVPKVNFEMKN